MGSGAKNETSGCHSCCWEDGQLMMGADIYFGVDNWTRWAINNVFEAFFAAIKRIFNEQLATKFLLRCLRLNVL